MLRGWSVRISANQLCSFDMTRSIAILGVVALCLHLPACHRVSSLRDDSLIVGTWLVRMPESPFPYHLFVFHPDGTMLQANPDAGHANTSDSNGMGVWALDGERVKGKFVEVTADRTTHEFVSRGEISFLIKVSENAFSGTASTTFYDANGLKLRGPLTATMEGQRVVP